MPKKTTGKAKTPGKSRRGKKRSKSSKTKMKWKNPSDPELYFYTADGSTIRSLEELPEALKRMDDDTYLRHVEEEKNDFSNWVRDVLELPQLSRDLEEAANRNTSIGIVRRTLGAEEDMPA